MVNYGSDEKYQVKIQNVDFYPELAGIKISNFPVIVACSIIPLWFDALLVAVVTLFSLFGLFYHAARREDEGRPLLLNSRIISLITRLPRPFRQALLPTLASIKPSIVKLRR